MTILSDAGRPLAWLLVVTFALVCTVVLGAGVGGRAGPPVVGADRPLVGPAVWTEVLAQSPVEGGVAADEVAFFEARLEGDGADVLAHRRLAGAHLLRFRAYNAKADLHRARGHLAVLEARDPDDETLLGLRTSLALAEHDFPAAVDAGYRARSVGDPADAGGVLALFDALWGAGRYEEARRLLERHETDEESIGRLAREARLVDGLGHVEMAEARMARVVELVDAYAEPPVVRAWARVEHGHFLLHSGRPGEATVRFREAAALVPGYPAALEGLGWIAYGVDENPQVAAALFRRALEIGDHLDLYGLLEEITRAEGDDDGADALRAAFLEAATDDPEREAAYLRPLALTLADDPARLDDALAYANADLALRRDRMAWATRGWVLHRIGRHDEAVADMERALAWGAPEPEVLWRAGVVLRAAGLERRGRGLIAEALEGRAELGPVVARSLEAPTPASS